MMESIYLCPADKRLSCSWEGPAGDIEHHFETAHNNLLFYTNSIEINLCMPTDSKLLVISGEIYLLQTCITTNSGKLLKIQLRYLGSKNKASKITYDIAVNVVDGITYSSQKSQLIWRTVNAGWDVNLREIEDFHGKLTYFSCDILIKHNDINDLQEIINDDKPPLVEILNINNRLVERNNCDEFEEKYLDALTFLDGKLEQLKQKTSSSDDDILDKISHLNLSILEEPFSSRSRKWSVEEYGECLEDISEDEANLACVSCGLDMLPPIYLCKSGHSVCVSCRSMGCKKCNRSVTNLRNTDLEEISRQCKHSCKYAANGCTQKLSYSKLREHEIGCIFCKYKCPIDCVFEGKFIDFVNHLKILHSSIKLCHSLVNEFPKNIEFFIVNQKAGIFYCRSEQRDHSIEWTATFCGPKERLFCCELIFKGGKNKDPLFLKRSENKYELEKTLVEMKKIKLKEKYGILTITSYNN